MRQGDVHAIGGGVFGDRDLLHDFSLTLVHQRMPNVDPVFTDREIREYFFNLMQMSVFEIVWFAHRHGQVPDDYYTSWEARMKAIAAEKSFRIMMASESMKIMHDEFQTFMKEMVRATPAQASPLRTPSIA